MQTNYSDKNSPVTDWFKITPDPKSVGNLFWWNIAANAVVGFGAGIIGEWGQVTTAIGNISRARIYIAGEKVISKKKEKNKPIKPEKANMFRAGIMFTGAATNAFQMMDATTTAGRIAGGLAFSTYLGLGISSVYIEKKKKKTVELASKAFQGQIDLNKIKENAVNDNIHPQNVIHSLKEKEGYIDTIAKISKEKEKDVTALYRIKQSTGYTILGRALFQVASGVINIAKGDLITGVCEIVGGGAFTYGANEYRKKEDREVKGRMTRLAKRQVLFRQNDPTNWDKNGNQNHNPQKKLEA